MTTFMIRNSIYWENDSTWLHLNQLADKLRKESVRDAPRPVKFVENDQQRFRKIECLQIVAKKVYTSLIRTDKQLAIEVVNRRNWANIDFNEYRGVCLRAVPTKFISFREKKQAQFLAILIRLISLLKTNKFITKRQLFYEEKKMFRTQGSADELVDDICCITGLKRYQLHIYPSSKGLIAGNAVLVINGELVDVKDYKHGFTIPSRIHDIDTIISSAKFVLLVEKESTFSRLMSNSICNKLPAVIITGKGFPDANTREMVNLLWTFLKIPILAVVDADPFGIEILCIYKYGSMSLSFMSDTCVTRHIQWLGIHPSDIIRFEIPEHAKMELTRSDVGKLYDLSQRPYIIHNHDWKKQLALLMMLRVKVESECFSSFSEGATDYLADVYIPQKIKHGGWI